MFGPKIKIGWGGVDILLRPFKSEEMPELANRFSSLEVHRYTLRHQGFTPEQELKWFQDVQDRSSDYIWAIEVPGVEYPIGSTGIHGVDKFQSCHSGIIICYPDWWGKGIASRAHIARTWFAATCLDRATIQSEVMEHNEASRRALERVGYTVTGRKVRCRRVGSDYVDGLILTWINPIWVPRLFPDGIPDAYAPGINRAYDALEKAKEVIELI